MIRSCPYRNLPQLLSFLLRHGLRYQRLTYWTKIHWRWINELRKFPYVHQQTAFEEMKRAIRQTEARIEVLDQAIGESLLSWRYALVVDALRALRGVNTTIAATLVAEIGDMQRFSNPRQLRPGWDWCQANIQVGRRHVGEGSRARAMR